MKKSRYTEEQVAYALRLAESGTPVADVCRQTGIAEATFYLWKKKYGSLGVPEVRELRQMREENARLKRLVADLTLDKQIPPGGDPKKSLRPARRRELAQWMHDRYQVSLSAGVCARPHLSEYLVCKSQARDASALRMRIRESRRRGRALATSAFGSCCGAKAGRTIRNGSTVCTASKGCKCGCAPAARSGSVFSAVSCRRRAAATRRGAWISFTISSSPARPFGS